MVFLGFWFILISIWAYVKRNDPEASETLLKILKWTIPLPYIAIELGWMVAEVGRQPWIVYGLMKTSDAVSPITAMQVNVSLPVFIILYGFLGAVDIYLLIKYARKGPDAEESSKKVAYA